jgi:hypothetical protein
MVLSPVGLVAGGPFASENGRVKIPGVCVNLSAAAGLVWGLASGHAVLVAPKVFEDFPGVHWLAVVGEGAGSACVVGAGDHGLGSFGCGGGYKLSPAGDCGSVVTVRPLQSVLERERVVDLVKAVALGLVTEGACG